MSVPRVTQQEAQAPAPQRIGVAMAVIMTGVLMTAVDTTIVVLALPEIQRGLHVALSAVVWVIISFLLVITLLAGHWHGARRHDRHLAVAFTSWCMALIQGRSATDSCRSRSCSTGSHGPAAARSAVMDVVFHANAERVLGL